MRYLPILLTALLFSACVTTRVTNSWVKPSARTIAFKRVAVLALVKDESRGLRADMESNIAAELNRRGYTAYSTFAEFGSARFERNSEEAAVARLKKSGTDAVVTVVLLDKSKEQNYVPGRVTYSPAGIYYNRFWGYYGTVYDRMYTPGYYTTNTSYFWETNLYDLDQAGDDLVYSAQSESFNPSSAERLARGYAKQIVDDMTKNGVLKQGTK